MLWEFKNNKNVSEVAEKISCVYGQRVIIDRQLRNWFLKFCSGDTSLRNERLSVLDQNTVRELAECNPRKSTRELAFDLNTSAICHHFKKMRANWAFGLLIFFVGRIEKITYLYWKVFFQCGIMSRFSRISCMNKLWFAKTKIIFEWNQYIYIYIYVVHSIRFQTFFVLAFKIAEDSWKFSMLLLYILWDDWPIFMISGSNEQLQQELKYTLLKPDCHSWWISKMQSGREDTL